MKKTIAIALVLMLCISALSISAFAADTFTVTVEIDSATAPNAWAWGDYGNAFPAWPGVAMTKSGNVWKIDVPMGTTGFIVNNGSAQTSDIKIPGTGDVTIKVSADFKSYEVVGQPAPVLPTGYFVTGSTDVFSNWTECNEAGKMTESNGIFVKEFTGVAAGDYELKVNDGTWANSWGVDGQNVVFNVADANSTVVVKFNPADGSVVVEVNGAGAVTPPAPPAVEYDAYYVTGSTEWLGNWAECNEAGKMTEENGVFVKTFENVTAGAVELKVNVGSWAADWGFNGNNFAFEVAEGDTVTVTFNPATQTVSVAVNGVNVNPGTGDMSLAGVGIALLAATAGLVALVGKKKEF
jgi:hypothetical protein